MKNADPSPRSRKWITRVVVTLFALTFLALAVTVGLSRFLDPEELATWLEPRLERALSRDVEVASVEVGLFPLRAQLREITVSDPTGMAPFLARVGSVDLQVKILPLLRREIRVHRLRVEGLDSDLRVSADDRTNFGDLSTRNQDESSEVQDMLPAEGSEQPFTLDLRGIRLSESSIRFSRETDSLVAEVTGLRIRATVRRDADGSWLLVGSSDSELSFRSGVSKPLLESAPLGLSFDVLSDAGFDTLRIRTGELRIDQIALTLSGEVRSLQEPVRALSLALAGEGIPLGDILAAMPQSARDGFPVEADGTLNADLRINGEVGPGHLPEVRGELGFTRGRFALKGKTLAENVTAQLSLVEGASVLTRVEALFLDGPLSVNGTVSLGDARALDLTLLATPDLDRLGSLVEFQDGITTGGGAEIRTRIVGPVGDLRGLRFNGEIKPASLRLTHPALAVPIEIPEGRFQLSGIRGIVENLPVSLGNDRLFISGEIPDLLAFVNPEETPRMEGSVRGPRLDLRKIGTKTPPDSTLTYGKIAFAKLGGRQVGNRRAEEAARELGLLRPDSLPVAGTLDLQLDTVIDRRGRMEDLTARLEFGPTFLRVTDAVFRRYGGEISTTANLTLDPEAAAPFSLNFAVVDLDAGAFLAHATPLGRFARGRISVALDLIGTLDGFLLPDRSALVGSGSFSLVGGGLSAVPLTESLATFLGLESLREPSVRDWTASFLLEEGQVRLADGTIQGAPGSPRVGGSVGLDGGLDLRSVFDLPSERLSAAAMERLGVAGEMAANVLNRPEVVQAVLRIGGSVLDPTIQADPRAAALTIGAAVEQEVRREAQEQIDAQRAEGQRVLQEQQVEAQRRIQEQKQQLQSRATGFLRGLVGGRDTVVVPPPPDTTASRLSLPDTAPPDTLRPDTIRTDTIRPDTVRTDTTRPDTVRPDTVRPDTVRPDTVRPDTVRPDTTRTDTVRPDRMSPLPCRPGPGRS